MKREDVEAKGIKAKYDEWAKTYDEVRCPKMKFNLYRPKLFLVAF